MVFNLISMEEITSFSDLTNKNFIPQDPFLLLGDHLKIFIKNILMHFKTVDSPVIKGYVSPHTILEGAVYVEEGASVEPFAYIKGPTYIGKGSEIRHGAYIRGDVYIGANCVVGHTTEVKSSIFLDGAKAGHFAYIGDSILGQSVNLGAGTKLANLTLTGLPVSIFDPKTQTKHKTHLRKLGSILGDSVQTGCNSVLSPGTILMPHSFVYPNVHFRGTLQSKQIAK